MKIRASRRMRPRELLILHIDAVPDDEAEALAEFASNLTGLCHVPVVILQPGMNLTDVSSAEMRAAGWVRAPHTIEAGEPDAVAHREGAR